MFKVKFSLKKQKEGSPEKRNPDSTAHVDEHQSKL